MNIKHTQLFWLKMRKLRICKTTEQIKTQLPKENQDIQAEHSDVLQVTKVQS